MATSLDLIDQTTAAALEEKKKLRKNFKTRRQIVAIPFEEEAKLAQPDVTAR